jgi:hypothetical protein
MSNSSPASSGNIQFFGQHGVQVKELFLYPIRNVFVDWPIE